MDEKEDEAMTEKEKAIMEKGLAQLDEMLRLHEQFKEEYGAKMAALTEEERAAEYMRQLYETREIIKKIGMKIVDIDED